MKMEHMLLKLVNQEKEFKIDIQNIKQNMKNVYY
jgi:hypothetical protein